VERGLYYGLLVAACLLLVWRVAAVRFHRLAWSMLALGVIAWTAAELYSAVAFASLEEQPFPSLADGLYLLFYPASYAGLLLLALTRVRKAPASLWIDGVISTFAAAALGAAVLVDRVAGVTDGDLATVATNLAYPLGDALLLALVVGVASLCGWRVSRAWALLGVSLAATAVADGVYLFQAATGTYVEGSPLDALWPASALLLAFAGWRDRPTSETVEARGRSFLVVPVVGAIVATALAALATFTDVHESAILLACATLVAVVIRLVLALGENSRLLALTLGEAATDALTGLPNRRSLDDDLTYRLGSASDERPWLLAIFDLDGFKQYNDSFGHPAGDALLQRLSARLEAVPTDGRAYRLGGDEFCLLAPAADASAAARILDAATEALSERGEAFTITSSFGAVFLPTDADTPGEALRLADVRLYAHKHQRVAERDRAYEPLLQALLERDPELQTHLERVADLAVRVGTELGLRGARLEHVRRAAQLHDIGKIAIPDDVLQKELPLDDEELALIRQHPVIGQRILSVSPALRPLADVVRSVHERWDGKGYPDGLAGAEIPLEARIVAASEAYCAIVEDRPYRPARTAEEALAELAGARCTQFDPGVVAALAIAVADVTELSAGADRA
jgi:diguanylate cyclase (GGDEF)-like protein